jgi:SAM-dependent methyltransferase
MPQRIRSVIKTTAETLLPRPILNVITAYRQRNAVRSKVKDFTGNGTPQDIFTKIYTQKTWGESGDPADQFCSGEGSHDPAVVDPYVNAISQFLSSFDRKLDVVDLGCGDFSVGSKIRELCGRYTACDVVAPLIAFNKTKYASLNVDFRVLDLVNNPLPPGDVVFVRQVLQHLSNEHIRKLLPKIPANYRYLVLTEHVPENDPFTPNLDFPTGPIFRMEIGSGVVITAKPFNFKAKRETLLCELPQMGGRIQTRVFEL